MESYRIVPKDLVVPGNALPNGTLQYAMISMQEKFLALPRRIRQTWFGPEKSCRLVPGLPDFLLTQCTKNGENKPNYHKRPKFVEWR
jgi:hypothetical protein